eukprot:gene1396-15808_t
MANDSDDEDIYVIDDNCELGHNDEDDEFDVAENNIDEDDQDIRYFESSDIEIACAEDNIETQLPEKKLFQEELASWAARNRCSREATNELLDILRRNGHFSLPKDSRTLLHTPRDIQSQKRCRGEYAYFGLEAGIRRVLTSNPSFCREYRTIKLNINIDGVPLFKSSNIQMWPILSSFNGLQVFIVALFCGTLKPSSAKEYLHDLVQDPKSITKDAIMFAEQKLDVVMLLDAVANRSRITTRIFHTTSPSLRHNNEVNLAFSFEDEIDGQCSLSRESMTVAGTKKDQCVSGRANSGDVLNSADRHATTSQQTGSSDEQASGNGYTNGLAG